MKKFKCVASRRAEKKGKRVKKQSVYESRSFIFSARCFKQAVVEAERIAKGLMVFESLKVSEL